MGYVAYMRSIDVNGATYVVFVGASSKLAPRAATSIPRLELCAAGDAAMYARFLLNELERKPDKVYLHTDSLVVLGYLHNVDKHFTKYVQRRIDLILNVTQRDMWCYVSTQLNPGDIAPRPHSSAELLASEWLRGPSFLWDRAYRPQIYQKTQPISLHEEKLKEPKSACAHQPF